MSTKSKLFASAAFPFLSFSLIVQPSHAFALTTGEAISRAAVQSPNIPGSYEVAQDAQPGEELPKRKKGGGEGETRAPEPGGEQGPVEGKRKQAQGGEGGAASQAEPAEKPRRPAAEPGAEPGGEPSGKPPRGGGEVQQKRAQQPAGNEAGEAQPKPGKGNARQAPAEEADPAAEPQAPKANKARKQPSSQAEAPAAEPDAPAQPKGRNAKSPAVNEEAKPTAPDQAPQPKTPDAAEKAQPPAPAQKKAPGAAEKPVQPAEGQPAVAPQTEGQRPAEGKPRPPATDANRQIEPAQKAAPSSPATPPATRQAPAAETQTPVPGKAPAAAQETRPQSVQPDATGAPPASNGTPPASNGTQPASNGTQPAQTEVAPANKAAPTVAPPAQNGQQVQPGQDAANQRVIPPPEKVTKQELEQRRAIAQDPSKAANQTVVLPVENGAPVLDSDKRSYRNRGVDGAAPQQQPTVEINNYVLPRSDADAQRSPRGRDVPPPMDFEALSRERGERLDGRPRFDQPRGARVDEGPSRDDGGRVVIQFGDDVVVRHDDDERFIDDGDRPTYDRLPGDRYREVIDRPDGWRIVTVRNRYGDVIQRSRVDRSGREYVLFYSPDLAENPDRSFVDPGDELPPMRLRVPLDDYIIDTSSNPDRDYYDFLREPPVEPVERVYSLNEVRYSARIRDKVRRIDLDTLTFATGSWEIPMSQAGTLRRVADAINEMLKKNPSETFLIEGHTDAVGTPESNLVLSDRRAESVARVMTEAYGIPAENMVTQGYGEQFLKVNTPGPNQDNRRVTIRRITSLVRPVASNQ